MNANDKVLTIQEGAERLQVKQSFFYEASGKGGTLKGRPRIIRVGRYLRIRESDLEKFLDENALESGEN